VNLHSAQKRFVTFASLALALVASLASGCGPGNVIAKKKTIEEVDDQQATCKVAKDPLNPLIVEWPATSKVALDSASKRGIVVVSYAGCTLKVLNECHAKGDYEYTGVTPARDKIDISSQDDLYARLPLGAVNLKGELDSGSSLKLDYIAVGQRVSKEAPTELEGDGCEGATHYVRTITLGAYALDVQAKAEAGAGVEVGNAGGGAKRKEGDQRLRGSGDVDKCSGESPRSEGAAVEAGCGAPLQLDLAPLRSTGGGHVVASSFGEGLHTLSLGPTELTKGDTNIAGVASLKDIDPDYLKLLQDALHADRGESVKPQDKANAWAALASYPGQNPKKKLAEDRRDAWQKTADDLEKLKTQYISDKSKLDKILALDDEVVPKKDKVAYQEQFKQTYEPHEKLLSVALGTNIGASSSSGSSYTGDKSSSSGSSSSSSSSDDEKFRIDAEGGWDVQQLSYDFVGDGQIASSTGGSSNQGKGDGGGSSAFVGAMLSLPSIPAPGVGLSSIVRYNIGSDVSRIVADLGLRIAKKTDNSGFGIGIYVGYVKLLSHKTPQGTSATSDDLARFAEYGRIIDASKGGVDFKLNFAYEYYFAPVISITAGAGVGYVVIPSSLSLTLVDSTTNSAKTVTQSSTVKGFGANANGGLSLHF
jgi:hypothetical protein